MKSRIRPLGAAIIVTMLVTLFAPAGAQAAESVRGRAERILVSQGMPADLASKIANDKSAKITVKSNEVYVDNTSIKDIQASVAASYTHIIPGAKGSDWWYAVVLNRLGQPKTVIYTRYSWSWMWFLKNNINDVKDFETALCAVALAIGPLAAAACGVIVQAYFITFKAYVNNGIGQKKCMQWRMPAPPLADYTLNQWKLVPCRV